MQNKLYRQGDVLLRKVSKLPVGVTKEEKIKGAIVLAFGEATGHHHAIRTPNATAYQYGSTRYIQVGPVRPDIDLPDVTELLGKMQKIPKNVALLTHEEHDPIALEPGVYEVILQREYRPEAIRRVAD